MGWKTWNSSALRRSAALLPLLCAPWGVGPALALPLAQEARQDSRADVAQKLARIEEALKTKVKQGKGSSEARATLDKEIAQIELWLRDEAGRLGPKDRAASVKTLGLVIVEVRPPAWGTVVGMSIQVNAAEVLGLIVPEGAPALLSAVKTLDPNKDPTQVWLVYKNIGRQGTPECLAALLEAAGRKDLAFLRGASDGCHELPSPTPAQRKAAFGALLEGWAALNVERAKKHKKPIEEDEHEITELLPALSITLDKLSGEKFLKRADFESWWKEHKKEEWK